MERRSVTSSNIASIGYDLQNSTLEIEFKSGAVWQYMNFPEFFWSEFDSCESHGKYFHANIKNQYPESRVG
ncbi:KTSC domain-containing protein [Massilia sp. S19_KUP03_FR1]|uniref:KTSC domain-containing protein n=1 Tax=Massilia sp. S19_KUP03_FR1 TaxID=3025503 RepID=UPI002FCDC758